MTPTQGRQLGRIPASSVIFSVSRTVRPLLRLLAGGVTVALASCGGEGSAPSRTPAGAAGAAGSAGVAGSPGSAGNDSRSCPVVPSEPPPPLLECSSTAAGTAPTLDDFNDGNLLLPSLEHRVGSWYSFTDETAGCAELKVERADSSPALHFKGGGFSAWGAAFGVSFSWSLAKNGLCTYDLSAYSGIRFRARGNAPLRMNIPSRRTALQSTGGDCPDSEGCFDQQGRGVALSAEFQELEIPFCSLAQRGFGAPLGSLDATQVTNVNFLVQSTNDFDVWLDDLELIPWQDGQSRDCQALCPTDELGVGITPRPDETWLDEEATGVRLFTFDQPTKDCGPITRRYLGYVPKSLEPASDAPVLLVLHGLGADAESMRSFITQGRFESLADRDGFIVVYGNAAPGTGTDPARPNGGGFRKDSSGASQVDDFAYLQGIIEDLAARGAISGDNPLFLAGLSDGGGMTHLAAMQAPTRYRGIAELMPYPGETVPMPEASAGFTLKRVLLGYSLTDPAMSPGYATQLVPLGPAWATALGLSPEERDAPQKTPLPDLVNEGADYQGTTPKALLTRDSHGEQLDYGSDGAAPQVRVLSFDHAGHLWPVPSPPDREEELAQFGLRNQDVDMSDAVWEFFRSCL